MAYQSITILGSTGSIGTQTLDVVRTLASAPRVRGLSSGGRNLPLFAAQIREFSPDYVHLGTAEKLPELLALLPDFPPSRLLLGDEGLVALAAECPADLVVVATVGWTGLAPALAALRAGRDLALANKEVLVCGGSLVMQEAHARGRQLLPVDSEHNAIFQCLRAARPEEVRRLILTCSGGPFRSASLDVINAATARQTLRHPTWEMGAKITVDSATLMNKGFEVIEAHHLFAIDYDRIDVTVHPQSTVHSLVEFIDGHVIAQLGKTDMRLPIQFALTFPERRATALPSLDFGKLGTLTFEAPDVARFPCLGLAYEVGREGGSAPCVLNAANEVAVAAHLADTIPCGAIPRVLRRVLDAHHAEKAESLEQLRAWDAWGRSAAAEAVRREATAGA